MALAFEMEGAIALIVARGDLPREDLPTLEGYVTLAEGNDARAILIDVTALSRVPTSALGALVRVADRLKGEGTLVGIVGLDAVRNPIVPPGFLAGRVPVFADIEAARLEVRRRIGAAPPL